MLLRDHHLRDRALPRSFRMMLAGADTGAFIEVPVELPAARKVREAPASFDDHFTQPRLFWLSMTPVEREHIIAAYTFELTMCHEQAVKERALSVLANIDPQLCEEVATGLGLARPPACARAHAADGHQPSTKSGTKSATPLSGPSTGSNSTGRWPPATTSVATPTLARPRPPPSSSGSAHDRPGSAQ
ncbi:hypothetical protein AMK15_34690 [Streptomyces sp. MJM1172]|nr:hypothetical protein AMK15_34690 [Streptomyces sp. MJM1172]